MKTIWKYEISTTDIQSIDMPSDARIISVHTQYGKPCIWVECDPDCAIRKRVWIRTYGTGHPIEETNLKFIGTYLIHQDNLVFHIYELGKNYEYSNWNS